MLESDEAQLWKTAARREAEILRIMLDALREQVPEGTAAEILVAFAQSRFAPQQSPVDFRRMNRLLAAMTEQIESKDP